MISAAILKKPSKKGNQLAKGAIILSQSDMVCKLIPHLSEYFYIIERRGWEGINDQETADIKLVEDSRTLEETRRKFPQAILLELAGGDFVDTEYFRPLGIPKDYDGIQISAWQKFKRPKLLVEGAAYLPQRKFVKFGHFFSGGRDLEEVLLRDNILSLTRQIGANIDYPFWHLRTNEGLPSKIGAINYWINRAKIGILTTKVEGLNRFKMECLAANVPMLVPSDVSTPTKKHISELTGVLYEPTPRGLAEAIQYSLSHLEQFAPRNYVLENTGKYNSLEKLRNALKTLCVGDNSPYHFEDIEWDGRNQSMLWEDRAIEEIRNAIKGFELIST